MDLANERDSKLSTYFWTWVFKKLKTILSMSSSYHPQSSAQLEANQII